MTKTSNYDHPPILAISHTSLLIFLFKHTIHSLGNSSLRLVSLNHRCCSHLPFSSSNQGKKTSWKVLMTPTLHKYPSTIIRCLIQGFLSFVPIGCLLCFCMDLGAHYLVLCCFYLAKIGIPCATFGLLSIIWLIYFLKTKLQLDVKRNYAHH